MRKFTLYSEGRETLIKHGLAERITQAERKCDLPNLFSEVSEDELPEMIDNMVERGYIPKPSLNMRENQWNHWRDLERFFQDKKDWQISNQSNATHEARYDDFLLFSGYIASFVLNPDEFWDHKKFGFSSLTDFFGSIGAYAWAQSHRYTKEGAVWETEKNKQKFSSQITGDMHGDLRIFRTDITPYETKDPLGYSVSYRPELDSDFQSVNAYHSQEPFLFVALMKYAEQEKIDIDMFSKEKSSEFIENLASKGLFAGPFGDFGHEQNGAGMYFVHYEMPIPLFDPDAKKQWSPYRIGTISNDMGYGIYLNKNRDLVFVYETEKTSDISLTFFPEDINNALKGVLKQTAAGVGRTSLQQIVNLLDYKFSPQFVEDKKRFRTV